MHPLIRRTLIKIQQWARRRSLREALEQARKINEQTDQKVLVYLVRGQFEVLTKQALRDMWKQGKFPGFTLQQLEKAAIASMTTFMNNKKQTKEVKPTPEQIKKLREETENKKGKTVKK